METRIVDGAGRTAGIAKSELILAAASESEATPGSRRVPAGIVCRRQSPALYRAVSRIVKDGKVVDEVETRFGIRTLSWSAGKGLLLNGTLAQAGGRAACITITDRWGRWLSTGRKNDG